MQDVQNVDAAQNAEPVEETIHPIDGEMENKSGVPLKKALLILLVMIIAGVVTGILTSTLTKPKGEKQATTKTKTTKKAEKTAGVKDEKQFKDVAKGVLKEGGINGEGEFHLERPGGESQNVYLTSTTVDLSEYEETKVKVWGQTFNAEAAGWFMEVGYLEVVN